MSPKTQETNASWRQFPWWQPPTRRSCTKINTDAIMTALHRPIRSVRIRDTKVSPRTKFSICWRKTPCLAMSALSSLLRTTSCDILRDGDFPTPVLTLAHLSAELFLVPIMSGVELRSPHCRKIGPCAKVAGCVRGDTHLGSLLLIPLFINSGRALEMSRRVSDTSDCCRLTCGLRLRALHAEHT